MIFVISYNRGLRATTWLGEFADSEMENAQALRLSAELDALASGISPEIVVLSAEAKSDLERSHSKYFPPEVFENQLKAKAGIE